LVCHCTNVLRRVFSDNTAHLEVVKGSPEDNIAYCTKLPRVFGPWEFGVRPKSRGRPVGEAGGGLAAIKRKIDDGARLKELFDADFDHMVKYHKGIERYMTSMFDAPARQHQTQCVVYWGPPGSGKTQAAGAFSDAGHTFWLAKPDPKLWFDGYRGRQHHTVVVDEFYGFIKRDVCQRLIDSKPLQVEVKGGSVNFAARTVIFTSNKAPEDWWPNVGLGAMERRLSGEIGTVVYVGDREFPSPESWRSSDKYQCVGGRGPGAGRGGAQVPGRGGGFGARGGEGVAGGEGGEVRGAAEEADAYSGGPGHATSVHYVPGSSDNPGGFDL